MIVKKAATMRSAQKDKSCHASDRRTTGARQVDRRLPAQLVDSRAGRRRPAARNLDQPTDHQTTADNRQQQPTSITSSAQYLSTTTDR